MDLLNHLSTHWNYLGCITLMMIGLYIAISRGNPVTKSMGVHVFLASVILLDVSRGKVKGGSAPILIVGLVLKEHLMPVKDTQLPEG